MEAEGGKMCLQAALAKGMQSLSQADVGSTLQVFFNLEELTPVSSTAVQIDKSPAAFKCYVSRTTAGANPRYKLVPFYDMMKLSLCSVLARRNRRG